MITARSSPIQCSFIKYLQQFRLDVPNSGRGLPRLDYRTKKWDVDFTAYLKKLDAVKPVVLCGDLNVSHLEIGKQLWSGIGITG